MCLFATLLSGNCLLTCLHCCCRLSLMKSCHSGKGLRSVGSKHCHQGRFPVFPLSHLHSDNLFDFSLCSFVLKEAKKLFLERNGVCAHARTCIYLCLCTREFWTQSAQSLSNVTRQMNLCNVFLGIVYLKNVGEHMQQAKE